MDTAIAGFISDQSNGYRNRKQRPSVAAEAAKEEKKEQAAAAVRGGGDALADDEKMENGKKYKKIIKKVTKTRPKAGSGQEYTKGAGGKIMAGDKDSPFDRKFKLPKGTKKPKVPEGQAIDKKALEDNKKALEAAGKYKACNTKSTFDKFKDIVKGDDAESLKKTAKITERIKMAEEVSKDIMKGKKWSQQYDAIIGLAAETMGWEGNDARNPTLAKVFLNLISEAMANGESGKKDSGMFSIYVSWACQRLTESKFNKLATECLLSTCYQYSPKVVFSVIEKMLLEPEDEKKSPFKNGVFMFVFLQNICF